MNKLIGVISFLILASLPFIFMMWIFAIERFGNWLDGNGLVCPIN